MALLYRRHLFSSRFLSTSLFRNKEADLVADAYLKQIRDLAAKQQAAGGDFWESAPEFKKELQEQMNRLAQKFNLPSEAAVTKLDLKLEKPTVESSVAAFSDGKPLEQLLEELKLSKKQYDDEQSTKKLREQELRAKLGQKEEEFLPFPMPLEETKAKALPRK